MRLNLKALEQMDAAGLREYVQFLLWHYRVADAFWYLYATEEFGAGAADKLNQRVWDKAGGLGAKELIKRFGLTEKGLKGFVKVLRLYPWSILINYQIEANEDEVRLTVPDCPSQQARLKHGLGEYACKEMHRAEFESIARAVDERIRVECVFAPPDRHPEGTFCQWRFRMGELTSTPPVA
jgi:hypothetical protein